MLHNVRSESQQTLPLNLIASNVEEASISKIRNNGLGMTSCFKELNSQFAVTRGTARTKVAQEKLAPNAPSPSRFQSAVVEFEN
jgi:hypothetical protein